jgi:hypothetical protein
VDDREDLRDLAQLQSVLAGDFESVVGYGEEHPGEWAGAWFDNEPAVRIVAAFAGDATRHDAALRPSFMVADDAAYAEHVAGGYVFTDLETVSSVLRLFNSIQVESYRASESLAVRRAMDWRTQATAGQTAASALSWPVTAG